MGGSGKPDLDYRLVDHVAVALDRLRRRPDDVRAVAFLEGHLRPLPGWEAFDDGGRQLFQRLRTPGSGEQLALAENFFLEALLPAALARSLAPAELDAYRAPYPTAASRRPLLQWARQIPVAGEPAEVARLMAAAADHLTTTTTPTLLVHGEPGVLVTDGTVAWCRRHLRSLTARSVGGPAGHFLPEDRPEQVAEALVSWVAELPGPYPGSATAAILRP